MCIYLLVKTETLTLSAPFRTLGREYVGTLPSLFQGVPGAREGRPAHGHVRASRPRGERVRGRRQALGHRDGSRRRRRSAGRVAHRCDGPQEPPGWCLLPCLDGWLPPWLNRPPPGTWVP